MKFADGRDVPQDYIDLCAKLFEGAIESDPGEDGEPPYINGRYQWPTKETDDGQD